MTGVKNSGNRIVVDVPVDTTNLTHWSLGALLSYIDSCNKDEPLTVALEHLVRTVIAQKVEDRKLLQRALLARALEERRTREEQAMSKPVIDDDVVAVLRLPLPVEAMNPLLLALQIAYGESLRLESREEFLVAIPVPPAQR